MRRRRAAAQLLAGGTRSPRDAVAHLLAVQAQDLRAARLALRARGAAGRAADVDAALADGSLVVTWLMRGTLHLVAAEDHGWLHDLTAGQSAATIRRRLGQLGIGPDEAERAVGVVAAALQDGPLARPQLGERLRAAGIAAEGQRLPHLLGLAAARGLIVLGPVLPDGHGFVPARDWLEPSASPPDRDAALAELARRYLRGHGPAAPQDLAAWSGLGLRAARAAFAAIAGELAADGERVDLAERDAPRGRGAPRLLPAYDPYLLGWRDRSFAVAPEHARLVHPGGGTIRATAIADGRAVATWTAPGGTVRLEPFAPLDPEVAAALEREAAAVAAFSAP